MSSRLLEARPRTVVRPVPVVALDPVVPIDDGTADEGGVDPEVAEQAPARGRHRLPTPPRRRPSVLLAAAVTGGLIAGVLGLSTGTEQIPVASAADYGLTSSDSDSSGGVEEVDVRQEITQAEATARLDMLAASRAAREPKFAIPLDGRLTTAFAMRWGSMHTGLDIAAPLGTPIYAAADGVVLRAGPASGFGYAIWIQDAEGNVQVYGHMRYIYVEAGQTVTAGDEISAVGNEGLSTGPHLHFEVRVGSMRGEPVDPDNWFAERGISR